jgi:hypothetical protein
MNGNGAGGRRWPATSEPARKGTGSAQHTHVKIKQNANKNKRAEGMGGGGLGGRAAAAFEGASKSRRAAGQSPVRSYHRT